VKKISCIFSVFLVWVLVFFTVSVSQVKAQSADPSIYVVNRNDNTVSVFDSVTYAPLGTIPVSVSPQGLAMSPDGRFVAVAGTSYAISLINTNTNSVVWSGGYGAWNVIFSPDGKSIYAGQSGYVYKLDVTTGNQGWYNQVAGNETGIAISPDGKSLYMLTEKSKPLPDGTSAQVAVLLSLDSSTGNVVSTLELGNNTYANAVVVSPDGKTVYVVGGNVSGGIVWEVDPTTNTITNTDSGIPGETVNVSLSTDGSELYGTNGENVFVFNTITKLVATIADTVKSDYQGIAVSPDGSRIYVTKYSDNVLQIFDTSTLKLLETINTGNNPHGVAVQPNLSPNPPVINSISNATINLGDMYTASGSFTDPDSSSWTATVDYGDGFGAQPLALAGTTFSLSHLYNSPGTFTVTVVITDDRLAMGTSTTTVTVNGFPPTANAGGPYTVPEGGTVTLQGTGSDVDGDTLSYNWDLDNNGTFETPGQNVTFSAANIDGPSSAQVTLQVCDGPNSCTDSAATVNITNVAPTATFSNNGPVNEGSNVTVSFSNQFDPSAADTASGFHYAFSCNNTPFSGMTYANSISASSQSCQFAGFGTYIVLGRIIDKDNGYTDYQTNVTVNNIAPVAGNISVSPSNPVAISTAVKASATFTDPGTIDTHTAVFTWGDGSKSNGTVTETNGSGSVTGSHTYTTLGNYLVSLTVTDNGGLSGASQISLVVVPKSGLSGANLTNVNYSGANLSGQNLSGSNLSGANLSNANLTGANLSGANASGSSFQLANLTGANMSGMNASKVNFQQANLTGVNLSGANLSSANFQGATLTKAVLTGANLSSVNFTGTNLNGAKLTGASTSGIVWSNTVCPDNTNSNNDGGTCKGHGV
jgi:YVTN family beta-propeller protein